MSRISEGVNIAVFVGIAFLILLPVSRAEGAGDNEPNLLELAKGRFGEPNEAEEKLFRSVADGKLADYSAETEEDNCPGKADKWGRERVLDANSIFWLCTDRQASAIVTHKGIQVKGARIEGELDLSDVRISFPLDFEKSAFPDGIDLRYAEIRSLYLVGSYTGPIYGDGLKVEGDVYLRDGFKSEGEVRFVGAKISEAFDCNDGKFFNEGRVAIYAGGLNVKEGVFLCNGFMAEGEVNLIGATIGGDLECGKSKFIDPNRYALDADRAKIMGSVFLNDGFTAEGEVRLVGATIGGKLECDGGQFIKKEARALNADSANIEGHVFLRNGFKSEGEVNLEGATIIGNLDCGKGRFIDPNGCALSAYGVNVTGAIYLCDGFKAEGEVDLVGATIGSDFDCSSGEFIKKGKTVLNAGGADIKGSVYLGGGFKSDGKVSLIAAKINGDLDCVKGKFIDPNGYALDADRAKIMGSVFLSDGFKAKGEVNLISATIGGNLDCNGGQFIKKGAKALNANSVNIKGDVSLGDGFTAEGQVNLLGATIGGALDCEKGQFINKGKIAIIANRANIGSGVYMRNGFKTQGEVDLVGATIGGTLDCEKGEFIDPNGYALSADGVNVAGDVFLRKGFKAEGEVDLTGATIGGYFEWWDVNSPNDVTLDLRSARIGTLLDDSDSWPDPGKLFLHGLVYKDLADGAPMDAESRIKWLRRQYNDKAEKDQDQFEPQPYEQLAKVMQADGKREVARKVLIARENDRVKFTKMVPFESIFHRLSGMFLDYGYFRWKPLLWGLVVIALGSVIFRIGYRDGLISPESDSAFAKGDKGITIPGDERKLSEVYPRYNFLLYSVDTFVPLIDLHQSKYWLPNANRDGELHLGKFKIPISGKILRYYLWFHIAMGWALSTLLVVGLTGLVRT